MVIAAIMFIIISFMCFVSFDYYNIGEANIFTLFSTTVQIFGCGVIGYYLSKKETINSHSDGERIVIIKIFRIVLIVAISIYLLSRKIRWRISDFVIQIGSNDFEKSLVSSSLIQQFIVTRLVSFEAVLAFLFGNLTYHFFRRKDYHMMNKKIISVLLVISVILSLSSVAFAYEEEAEIQTGNVTVISYPDSLSADMVERIEEGVYAYTYDEDGNKILFDCDVTIREVPRLYAMAGESEDENIEYEMEVATTYETKDKINSDEINTSTVTCTMYMIMRWIDRPGLQNAMTWLTGKVNLVKGPYTAGRIEWGNNHNSNFGVNWTTLYPNEEFGFNPGFDYADMQDQGIQISGKLHAHMKIRFSPDKNPFYLCVEPTIFD